MKDIRIDVSFRMYGIPVYKDIHREWSASSADHLFFAMNNYDMEANSRPELLTSFKVAYGDSMKNVCRILTKFCPEKSVQEIQDFIYVFFPFMFGIYPYTAVTDKQREAMKQANVDYVYQSIFEITNNCLLKLL